MCYRFLLPLMATVFFGITPTRLPAAAPWPLAGWSMRAAVTVTGGGDADADTAGVKILCQGAAKSDGSDFRVVDAQGQPVPFQLVFHDAGRYALVLFRATPGSYGVYFGNPGAGRAAEEVAWNPAPGSGAPQGSWIPHAGLTFSTIERPGGANPESEAELAAMLAASGRRHGGRFQRRISDGYNPFGPSDFYMSQYRGWIRIPRDGKYAFCTASNEGSFSFLDGRPLVHWPGRHTEEQGSHGEHNAEVELTAGLHCIEYYQEEVTLTQMAFLGWRPPGQGNFSAIPESAYPAPHAAVVTAYETPAGPAPRFEPVITDSVWPITRPSGQYTRVEFRLIAGATPSNGLACTWDFGDGQSATGTVASHVFLTTNDYAVTLTVAGPGMSGTARWPLRIYEIQHVTADIQQGHLPDYVKTARAYDHAKLGPADLRELISLLAESGASAEALQTGREWIARFATGQPDQAPEVRRLMADNAFSAGSAAADEAIAGYRAAIAGDLPLDQKIDACAKLVHLFGVLKGKPDEAWEFYLQAEQLADTKRLTDQTRPPYRRAVISAGDVRLWQDRQGEALELYRKAEALRDKFIPAAVRAARTGNFPDIITDYLERGLIEAASHRLDQWEETFPADKVKGETFFWRGKILTAQGNATDALVYLKESIALAAGAAFETEARWLLAQAFDKTGQPDQAQAALRALATLGIADTFTAKAKEQLKLSLPASK